MKKVPENYESIDNEVCSNFDGVIDQHVVKQLKDTDVYSGYPARDWFGKVWYDKETHNFCCQVMRFGSHIDTVETTTMEELKEEVSDKYGWE